jgi:hypothetical protein
MVLFKVLLNLSQGSRWSGDLNISNKHLINQSSSSTHYIMKRWCKIMSNIRHETQLLVPVIPPIGDDPFSTFIVLNQNALHKQAGHYFVLSPNLVFIFDDQRLEICLVLDIAASCQEIIVIVMFD